MILIKTREEADKENARIFSNNEDIDSGDELFTCVLCGREVSLSDSSSINGHLLVCGNCMCDYFQGSWENVREWQNKELGGNS